MRNQQTDHWNFILGVWSQVTMRDAAVDEALLVRGFSPTEYCQQMSRTTPDKARSVMWTHAPSRILTIGSDTDRFMEAQDAAVDDKFRPIRLFLFAVCGMRVGFVHLDSWDCVNCHVLSNVVEEILVGGGQESGSC